MSYYPNPPNVYQPSQPPIPPQSGMATAGFVVSLIGLVLSFLPFGLILCPVGIILSGVGIYHTSNGQQRGRAMATAGLTCGVVGLIFSLTILLLLVRH